MAVAAAASGLTGSAAAETIRVQSTTDTVDAGLVDGVLKPEFAKVYPNDEINYVGVGTGAALQNARNGLADLVITHAPSLEKQFVDDGYSQGLGRQIFYSDYVIIGSTADPAGVLAAHPNDAAGAFEDIATAGATNGSNVNFRSRNDNSGTNVQEQIIWGLTTITKQQASNASGNPDRFQPGSGGMYPTWYTRIAGGQAANVNGCSATPGCYTMVDRGTFNRLVNAGTVTNMKIVSQKNAAAARGGENLLINPFGAYIVNPDKFADGSKPNTAAAKKVLDFIVSPGFQKALESFPSAADPAFIPDAFPNVAVTLPPSAVAGTPITLNGTVSNRLPGGGAVKGIPVQLRRKVGDAASVAVGDPVNTGDDGKFAITTTPDATATYSVSTPDFAATSYNQFTGTEQTLGAITVVPVATPTPGPTTSPTPAPTTSPTPSPGPDDDTTKPRIAEVKLARRAVKLQLSERASLTVRVQKRRGGTFRTIRTVETDGPVRRGAVRLRVRKLKKGRYRIRIVAEDAAGNVRNATVKVRRK